MEIIKNKRESWCKMCGSQIDSPHKVKYKENTYHLNCFRVWLSSSVEHLEERLKLLKIFLRKFKRYHKEVLVESLAEK